MQIFPEQGEREKGLRKEQKNTQAIHKSCKIFLSLIGRFVTNWSVIGRTSELAGSYGGRAAG